MNEPELLLIFLAVGFGAGILIGMLGVGGGVIFVPSLYYLLPYFGVSSASVLYFAISISLLSGAIAASFSTTFHLYAKNVDVKKGLLFALGSSLAAFVSVIFVTSVGPEFLKIIFAVILFIVAIYMLLDMQFKSKSGRTRESKLCYLPIIGLSVGVLASFTGLGGGVIFLPVLHYLYLLNTKMAVGTSSFVTALTMISASLSFFVHQENWTDSFNIAHLGIFVALPLGVGAIAGAKFGFNLVKKLKPHSIKKIFAVLLIMVVAKIIFSL